LDSTWFSQSYYEIILFVIAKSKLYFGGSNDRPVSLGWIECFFRIVLFLKSIFLTFCPSSLSCLRIKLHNLFWFTFYWVVSFTWSMLQSLVDLPGLLIVLLAFFFKYWFCFQFHLITLDLFEVGLQFLFLL